MLLGSVGIDTKVLADLSIGTLRIDNEVYSLPFPEGFCDKTESLFGIQTLSFLNNVSSKNVAVGKPKILWEDDNVSIVVLVSKMAVNGSPYNELSIYASTVFKERVIQITTYDEVGNHLNGKAYTLDLAKSAARFKKMN